MSDDEFRRIAQRVRRHSGLSFEDGSRYVVERRLRARLESNELSDFAAYERLLCGPDGARELDLAIDALVTNETYFFREAYQLNAFEKELLPRIYAKNEHTKRLSIWSAGCSTGEEVYSLAMIVKSLSQFDDWDVRVFGSDISRRVIRHARRGIYGESSFRAMQSRFDHFFRQAPGGREVIPEVREICHFARVNLVRPEQTAVIGTVDAVFCRNVLIYFAERERQQVVRTLFERLVPGGYLLLGHSESLFRGVTDFQLEHLSSDLVYRRPDVVEVARGGGS